MVVIMWLDHFDRRGPIHADLRKLHKANKISLAKKIWLFGLLRGDGDLGV